MRNRFKPLPLFGSLLLLPLSSFAQTNGADCTGLKAVTTAELSQREEVACKLNLAPACERIPQLSDQAIFVATVQKIVETEGRILLDGHCDRTKIQTVTVQVKESFSGPLPTNLVLHAGDLNGEYFNKGETAIIFAKRLNDGTYSVSGCSGTTPVGKDWPESKEDLEYLRSRDKLPLTSSIMGAIFVVPPEDGVHKWMGIGFGNQTLAISGPRSIQVTTAKTGEFKIDDLPPGAYTVHIGSSKRVFPSAEQQVNLKAKGCAHIEFGIESAEDYREAVKRFVTKANANHP